MTYWDLSAVGRAISRAPIGEVEISTGNIVTALYTVGGPNASAFAAIADRFSGAGSMFVGSKHFWMTDYTTHAMPSFMMTLRMHSNRTYAAEYVNGENLQAWHMADGATMLYRRGDEYLGISPVWSWTRVPGVFFCTCLYMFVACICLYMLVVYACMPIYARICLLIAFDLRAYFIAYVSLFCTEFQQNIYTIDTMVVCGSVVAPIINDTTGTTARQDVAETQGNVKLRGSTAFVGGVCLDGICVSAMDFAGTTTAIGKWLLNTTIPIVVYHRNYSIHRSFYLSHFSFNFLLPPSSMT